MADRQAVIEAIEANGTDAVRDDAILAALKDTGSDRNRSTTDQ